MCGDVCWIWVLFYALCINVLEPSNDALVSVEAIAKRTALEFSVFDSLCLGSVHAEAVCYYCIVVTEGIFVFALDAACDGCCPAVADDSAIAAKPCYECCAFGCTVNKACAIAVLYCEFGYALVVGSQDCACASGGAIYISFET